MCLGPLFLDAQNFEVGVVVERLWREIAWIEVKVKWAASQLKSGLHDVSIMNSSDQRTVK
jgi:hypothetical protein